MGSALLALGLAALSADGHGRVRIDLPHLRQGPMLCVPTSAAMVLRGYGAAVSPDELKRRATKPGHPHPGTMPWDIVRAVDEFGFPWRATYHAPTEAAGRAGLRQLRRELAAGRPVLVDTDVSDIGHTVVLTGYDRAAGTLAFLDPGRPPPGRFDWTEAEFLRHWRSAGLVRIAVLTAPKPAPP